MTERHSKNVPNCAQIVDDFMKKYPKTERRAIKNLIRNKYPDINVRTLDRNLHKVFPPTELTLQSKIPKLKSHRARISSGLRALCPGGKYIATGQSVANKEFAEFAIQHLTTSHHPIIRLVGDVETSKKRWKETYSLTHREEFLKKRQELMARIETLAREIENDNELLEGSWCQSCAGSYGFTIKQRDEDEAKKLLDRFDRLH